MDFLMIPLITFHAKNIEGPTLTEQKNHVEPKVHPPLSWIETRLICSLQENTNATLNFHAEFLSVLCI